MSKIGVIGLGFVGLTTALGFAEKGFKVYGFDVDKNKRQYLTEKQIYFYEPFLQEALDRNYKTNFFISDSFSNTIQTCDIIFYCVGTPANEDGSTNLNFLMQAIRDTCLVIKQDTAKKDKILVIKSTIPPTTTNKIYKFLESEVANENQSIQLCNNPEFLREGFAWDDFINPDRIVVGTQSERILDDIYKSFDAPIHYVSYAEGEFIKYLSNTLLATLISYSNEMSILADQFKDINLQRAFKILHQDKRWYGYPAKMTSYVYPGCGFGGYCLPKDIAALYSQGLKSGYDATLIKAALQINKNMATYVVKKILKNCDAKEPLGILGLSFKPNSDDVRESPANQIISKLISYGYKQIVAYDPLSNQNFENLFKLPIQFTNSLSEIKSLVKNIVVLTAWDDFKECSNWSNHLILDFRYYISKSRAVENCLK